MGDQIWPTQRKLGSSWQVASREVKGTADEHDIYEKNQSTSSIFKMMIADDSALQVQIVGKKTSLVKKMTRMKETKRDPSVAGQAKECLQGSIRSIPLQDSKPAEEQGSVLGIDNSVEDV